MAKVIKLNDSRKAEFSFEENEKEGSVPLTIARSVIVRTSGKADLDRGIRLIIHHSTILSYLPNDAISLAYIKVENLIPRSTSRTINGKLAVQDGPPLVYTRAMHMIKKATYEFKWDRLFGTSADQFLTPIMAARIHDMAGSKVDHELRDYYTEGILLDLPEEGFSFFQIVRRVAR